MRVELDRSPVRGGRALGSSVPDGRGSERLVSTRLLCKLRLVTYQSSGAENFLAQEVNDAGGFSEEVREDRGLEICTDETRKVVSLHGKGCFQALIGAGQRGFRRRRGALHTGSGVTRRAAQSG